MDLSDSDENAARHVSWIVVTASGSREKGVNVPQLKNVKIKGFRSIKEMDLDLRPINVCIGANGAGKSNLIAFFKLMNEMMGERLQQFIGTTGRATANLYFGPRVTLQLEAELRFDVDQGTNGYGMRLFHAAGDSLVFAEEVLSYQSPKHDRPQQESLGAGHEETLVKEHAGHSPLGKTVRHLLSRCRVYHFHDTSQTARVRQYCYVGDSQWLMPDAANLAAVLYRLRSENDLTYRRIVRNVKQVAPFFVDFDLRPSGRNDTDITLNWRHRDSDLVFGPHQLSDGTLRAMCLIALLQQPKEDLPYVIVVDEPELGLHPHALDLIASLFQAASSQTQVFVSTQSSRFVDAFEPEDIVVVERDGDATTIRRPDPKALGAWLEDYSLGEVWEKNVIGGGPH